MKEAIVADLISDKISGEWGVEPNNGTAIKVIRTTNFTNNGRLNLESVVEREIERDIVEKKKLKYGDTIIEKSGGSPKQPVGRVVFFNIESKEPYLCNNFTAILRPSGKVDPKYFFFALFFKHLSKGTLKYQNKTTGILNLKLERYLTEEKIHLPDLKTQQKIAHKLEQADAAREKRRQSNVLTEQFLQSAFVEMFGDPVSNERKWDIKALDEVCEKITDGTHFSPPNSKVGIYKYITAKNIKSNGYDFSNITFLDEASHRNIFNRCNPEFGDVLYIKDGVTTGIAMVNTLKEEFSLLSSVALFKLKRELDPFFLTFYLNNNNVYESIRRSMGGAAITRLTLDKLKRIPILLPPVLKQKKFAQIVAQVEFMRTKQKESEKELENLFQSLMQRYFG